MVSQVIVLTKDNLLKRNWRWSKKCCFCIKDEIVQHLFIDCPLACLAWWVVQYATTLYKSHGIETIQHHQALYKRHDIETTPWKPLEATTCVEAATPIQTASALSTVASWGRFFPLKCPGLASNSNELVDQPSQAPPPGRLDASTFRARNCTPARTTVSRKPTN